ncbi:hypothetical protein L484_012794 [Morus notabilis]|uniref:Uncharacterized protein n=1 Tax=Morus notabilis TaxID=981085 RepID=W9SIW9_9ROSA|nr:uncharacterized protein LOC21395988 isoform X2 [Morus notabilis]EXC33904.1 hypothetical protein L484_012794 [Morus notabilis]
MENAMEIVPPSSEHLDLDTIRSRAKELEEMLSSLEDNDSELFHSDLEKLVKDCALKFQSRMEEIGSEWSDVSFLEDKGFDACLEHLGEELNLVEAENSIMSEKIEVLTRTYAEDSNQLEIELEGLKNVMDLTALQDLGNAKLGACDDYPRNTEDKQHSLLELEKEIKQKNIILKSLEDLDGICKWFDAIEQIEDILTGVKVIALEENCIRFSLQTYIPNLESFLLQQTIEAVNVPFEVKHELLIELLEWTLDQKNVEIFPNDVYLNNISNAAKDFSKCSLQWFVTKVQDRIVSCTMRQLVVKSANTSGYSLEYFDKDEVMVAHLAGGVDAFIKVSQGWPLSNSPLKLTSLKSSDHNTKGIPSIFLFKVKERVNSLAVHICQNLSSFVDAVDKILTEQKQLEIGYDDTMKNDQ